MAKLPLNGTFKAILSRAPKLYTPMALPVSRFFRLAAIATIVALASSFFGTSVCLAQNKSPATKPADDPLTVLFTKAMLAMDQKKYDEALKNLDEIEKKAPKLETKLAAVVQFKRASCYYLKKDWAKAEGAINLFLTKFFNYFMQR